MEIKKEIKQNNNVPAIADTLSFVTQEIGKIVEKISIMLQIKSGPEFFSKTASHEKNQEVAAKLNQDIVNVSNAFISKTPELTNSVESSANLAGAGQ